MIVEPKVIWSEGLFLLPQHFQQQERYVESLQRAHHGTDPYAWGFCSYELDFSEIARGRLAVRSAAGIFPDGTPFQFPESQVAPDIIELPRNQQNYTVYLGLPIAKIGSKEVHCQEEDDPMCRYRLTGRSVGDAVTNPRQSADLQMAALNLRLFVDRSELDDIDTEQGAVAIQNKADFAAIPLLRVLATDANGFSRVNEQYMPPTLDVSTIYGLAAIVRETYTLLNHRAKELAEHYRHKGTVNDRSLEDFLLLSAINRHLPTLDHYRRAPMLHPERLYSSLLALCGDLASFQGERLAPEMPAYKHEDLFSCFNPLFAFLRRTLTEMQSAPQKISLVKHSVQGRYYAEIEDRSLYDGDWVLAVKAEMPLADLRGRIHEANGMIVGSIESLKDLIRRGDAKSRIALKELPVVPSEIQYYQDHLYFQLDRNSPYWPEKDSSAGFALQVIGRFPGLSLTLWSIARS